MVFDVEFHRSNLHRHSARHYWMVGHAAKPEIAGGDLNEYQYVQPDARNSRQLAER